MRRGTKRRDRGRARTSATAPAEPRDEVVLNPWWDAWLRLTPAERWRRAWRLRAQLRNPQRIHDAKTLPSL